MSLDDLVDMIIAVDRSYVDAEIGASVRLRMQADIGKSLKAGGWTWDQLDAAVAARQGSAAVDPKGGSQPSLFGESDGRCIEAPSA